MALTPSEAVSLRLSLLRGVFPLTMEYCKNSDHMVQKADEILLKRKMLKRGDAVILVSGRQALPAARFMAKIHRIGEG